MRKLFEMLLVLLAMSSAVQTPMAASAESERGVIYELFSWHEKKSGDWSFCILHNTNSEKSVQQVFGAKSRLRGLDALKGELAQLPAGATIVWLDRIPLDASRPVAKGSERLALPPRELVAEIRDAVANLSIKLVMPEDFTR